MGFNRGDDGVDINSQCLHPEDKRIDYQGAILKGLHSQYFGWKTVKIVYDLFDNVDGDPIFKEIMAMSDKEYTQANSLNIDDGERMGLFDLSQYHRTYGPDEPFTVSGPTKEEMERLMGRTVNYESGLD